MAPPRWRPPLPLLLIAILLGLITTLASTLWAAANHPKISRTLVNTQVTSPAGDQWRVVVFHGRFRSGINVTVAFAEPLPEIGAQEPPPEVTAALPHHPWRYAVRRDPLPAGAKSCFWNHQAYGWPMRALSGGFYNINRGGVQTTWIETGWRRLPMIPAAPIWPGLIVDTAFFSIPWLLILLAPVYLRRLLRRRRPGHCTHCNYDLRGTPPGSPCPECGHTLARQQT